MIISLIQTFYTNSNKKGHLFSDTRNKEKRCLISFLIFKVFNFVFLFLNSFSISLLELIFLI